MLLLDRASLLPIIEYAWWIQELVIKSTKSQYNTLIAINTLTTVVPVCITKTFGRATLGFPKDVLSRSREARNSNNFFRRRSDPAFNAEYLGRRMRLRSGTLDRTNRRGRIRLISKTGSPPHDFVFVVLSWLRFLEVEKDNLEMDCVCRHLIITSGFSSVCCVRRIPLLGRLW